jgi:hypothetical protein
MNDDEELTDYQQQKLEEKIIRQEWGIIRFFPLDEDKPHKKIKRFQIAIVIPEIVIYRVNCVIHDSPIYARSIAVRSIEVGAIAEKVEKWRPSTMYDRSAVYEILANHKQELLAIYDKQFKENLKGLIKRRTSWTQVMETKPEGGWL